MSTTIPSNTFRVRHTQLAWRIPHLARAADPAPASDYSAIGTAYADSPPAASPGKAVLAAVAATIALYVSFGALALPAAAFA